MELTSILFVIACVFPLYGFTYGLIFVGKPFVKGYWYYLAAFYVYVLVLEGTVVIWSGRVSAIHGFLLFLGAWLAHLLLALNAYKEIAKQRRCTVEMMLKYRQSGATAGIVTGATIFTLAKVTADGFVAWGQVDYMWAAFAAAVLGVLGESVAVLFCKPTTRFFRER